MCLSIHFIITAQLSTNEMHYPVSTSSLKMGRKEEDERDPEVKEKVGKYKKISSFKQILHLKEGTKIEMHLDIGLICFQAALWAAVLIGDKVP